MLAFALRKKWFGPELGVLAGLAAGAGFMYLADPDRGRRRRATARDKVVHTMNQAGRAVDRSLRDLTNRAHGLFAETLNAVLPVDVPDEVLVDRVRTHLGRLVSHPACIEVRIANGHAILRGDVADNEVPHLLAAVGRIPGVRSVIDNLTPRHRGQGEPVSTSAHRRRDPELLRARWAPSTRAVVGATGMGLMLAALWKRGAGGAVLGITGGSMLLRSITNIGPIEGMGLDPRMEGVAVQKTATIDAPVEQVFDLLVNPDKLPRVMDHVEEVARIDDTHYHWTVIGPAGTPLSWDSEITRIVPNELLAWRSGPGAAVKNTGVVQFEATENGGTRVQIRMNYLPPGGFVGHTIAELLDADPKHVLDQDLSRLKSLVERGHSRVHRRKIKLEDVEK